MSTPSSIAPAYLQAFDEMIAQSGKTLRVAVRGDEVVGCLQLTISPGNHRAFGILSPGVNRCLDTTAWCTATRRS